MRKQTIQSLLAGTCLMLALTGCSSTKHAVRQSVAPVETASAVQLTRSPQYEAVTAKVNLTLKLNGKDPVKLGGTLRIRRDEVVQLSVTYLLGIEVGRLEIAPDGLTVIDRVNKRYVSIPFDELTQLTHADLNYYNLQALFLNEYFLPGQQTVTDRDAASFAVTTSDGEATLTALNTRPFEYRFRAALADSRLEQSHIGYSGTAYALNWDYSDFRTLGAGLFPALMQVDFEGSSKPASLTLELSKLATDMDWETRTKLSAKYTRVEWQDLLAQLMKL
jgi:hypothetical protein